jgi:hypothetical protein
MLRDAGAEVVGPADTIGAAERLIALGSLSAAWLDVWVNENTREIWPVARLLASQGVPFLFCTRVPGDVDAQVWPGRPVIQKQIFSERGRRAILGQLANMIQGRIAPAAH